MNEFKKAAPGSLQAIEDAVREALHEVVPAHVEFLVTVTKVPALPAFRMDISLKKPWWMFWRSL